ncbi:MAG: CDP-diacylglycerol--serine O-phosphatidyltransferase [Hyphomicrobiales bacterium]|nr:MAG: CDP-diacylglycerol--serine O-phosphatidyltransferase [Hyphomicrobiales bacterium]
MEPPFPEFDPVSAKGKKTGKKAGKKSNDTATISTPLRLREVPFRMLVPNLITLGAICSGLSSIRFAIEDRFELAIVAIVFAALLDGLDGRVARFLKSATAFGEQMDSLADFVNFGVAPALVLYLCFLKELNSFGWIVALVFALCACLRLARFNVTLDDPDKPKWHSNFFVGVPAPAGALLGLLPIYLSLLGYDKTPWLAVVSSIYVLGVAFLLVSNLPTWSGKQLGKRVSRRYVLPLMMGIILAVVFLFSYPWTFLAAISLAYLATLPLSYRDWHQRNAADQSAATQED